nr:serine/threonine-protein kinase [Pseudenhygromyxa sp. WMMC2535]
MIGTTIAERYRIDALLGVGGMGAVFRAHHLLLKRDVAVKVLHRELVANEDISRRFDREAQSAARLDHPNVIPVTEFGSTDSGMKYMVMQLLEGQELSYMLTEGPLDPMRAIELEVQILRGLEHAHNKGVIHRDLKPENVFVTTDHEDEEVLKLVDFGIAKIVDEDDEDDAKPLTRMGLIFGTPHYMSPEQATGSIIDQRTDVYSAGVLLYQMLAGRVPFDHEDPVSLVRMQVTVEPPPLPPQVPPQLVNVVQRMMAKEKDVRYQDARSARKDLQAVHSMLCAETGVPMRFASEDTGVVDPRDIYGSGGVPGSTLSASGSAPVFTQSTLDSSNQGLSTSPTMVPVGTSNFPAVGTSNYPAVGTTGYPSVGQSGHGSLQAMLASIPRKWLYAGGGFIGLLILIALLPLGGSDEDEADAGGEQGGGLGLVVAERGEDEGGEDEVEKPGASKETLISIDQALTSKNEDDALDVIRPALDQFPEDPQLLWREGKALSMKRARSSRLTALERYGDALDHDPSLIENPDFYAELYTLLRNRSLEEQAINLAVQKLGPGGHKFLLELVNVDDPKKTLSWIDRHRVLNVLGEDEDASKLVDWNLNLARDLYQSDEAPKPCIAFSDTLNSVLAAHDVYFVEHLFNDKLEPPEFKTNDAEDGEACALLEDKLDNVRKLYIASFPDETAEYAKSNKKRSTKKSSKKKKK